MAGGALVDHLGVRGFEGRDEPDERIRIIVSLASIRRMVGTGNRDSFASRRRSVPSSAPAARN